MKEKDNIFGLLLFITQRWTVKGDAILLQKAGIATKQWMLLVILMFKFKNQQPTISETAKEFGTSRQNLKQVAITLQKKGFINIKPDPNDFRIQRITLTGNHQHLFEGDENEQWQSQYINSLFNGFENGEIIQLNAYVERLLQNV
ncbi:MAG: MarR family winged helix-turn-helix transcriptional regulator [Prolixibacteraceae bacterium]